MSNLKIGLHMIVKEDVDTIETCLRSCREFVDYMTIAVDSKPESDQTFRLCKKIAGKGAYRQDWQNNFSIARNDALNKLLEFHPDTDYVFWLDGDDRIASTEEGGASFKDIRERLEEERPYIVSSPYVYSIDETVKGTLPNLQFYRNRLWKHIPENPAIRVWYGAAHECDIEAGAPRGAMSVEKYGNVVVWKDLIVVHKKDGKVVEKTLRNLKILEDAHQKDPTDTRTMFYLGREYRDAGLKEKAILMLQKYLLKTKFIEEKYDALMNIAYMFRDLKDPHSAEKFAKEAFELKPELALAPAFLGELYLHHRMFGMAKPWLSYAIHAPHGSILFDEVSARTYVPHKLISKCFFLTQDIENAKRHHRIAREMAPFDLELRQHDIWLADGTQQTYPAYFTKMMEFIDKYSKDACEKDSQSSADDELENRTTNVISYVLNELASDDCMLVLGDQELVNVEARYRSKNSVYVMGGVELGGLNNVFLLEQDEAVLKDNPIRQSVKVLLVSLLSKDFDLKFLNTVQVLETDCLVIVERFGSVENNMAKMLKTFKDLHFLRNYSTQLGIGVFL